MARPCAKTFRNSEARARFFGLELESWAGLLAFAGILLAVPGGLSIKVAIIIGLWAWMYFVKAKRPPGYTQALWEYYSPAGSPISRWGTSFKILGVGLEALDD